MFTEIDYKPEYALLSNGIINVTDDCNLQCKYCFVEQHPHYMTLDTAKAIADFLYKNAEKKKELGVMPKNKKCDYYFFGGEPMLQYEQIIKPMVEYCETIYPNQFKYGITTNGTLLTKEVIDFFKKYKFGVMISMDGIKESQDFTRPCRNKKLSSYDLLIKNIPYLLEQLPNTVTRGTVYRESAQYLLENYKFAESLGFKNWAFLADHRHPWTQEQMNILEEQINEIYRYRLNQLIEGKLPMHSWRHSFWMRSTINLLDPESTAFNIEENNSILRCGLGTTLGAIGYDGAIYGCQEQCSKENKNIFYIGNIFNGGIDIEKHKALLNLYLQAQDGPKDHYEKCVTCPLRKACAVNTLVCPSSTFDLYNNFETIDDFNCFLRQIYFKNSLLYLNIFMQCKHFKIIEDFLKSEIEGIRG